jgi:predicted O-linked N-acetylglucosamine transferase (SPINDLY family)
MSIDHGLFDSTLFARRLEEAFERMLERCPVGALAAGRVA